MVRYTYLIGATELFGRLCIAFGVFTRPAALAAAALLAVATLTVHLPNGFFWTARGIEYPLKSASHYSYEKTRLALRGVLVRLGVSRLRVLSPVEPEDKD